MDKSLDEIIRAGSKRGANRHSRFMGAPPIKKKKFQQGSIKNQQIHSGPAFNVTGLGNVQGFDARQKIKVKDARDKIAAKKKIVDARFHLQNKTTQQKPLDARSKIDNAKSAKLDARQLIQSKQEQNKQQQVVVTGLGNVNIPKGVTTAGNKPLGAGGLQKSIKNENFSITRTVPQNAPQKAPPQQRFQKGNNITVVARQNIPKKPQPKTHQVDTPLGKINLQGSNPVIKIKNDLYEDVGPTYHQPQRVAQKRVAPPAAQPMQTKLPRVQQATAIPPQERTRLKPPPVVARPKPQMILEGEDEELIDEIVPSETVVSPLQGFRVAVTNLHPVVTQEDVVELFGAVGALKKARLVQVGTADVVFVKREDAINAVKKYHMRELDGQPMQVNMKTPAPVKQPIASDPASRLGPPPSSYQQATGSLRFMKPGASAATNTSAVESNVDTGLIHKALFKTAPKEEGPATPVTFTVKI